MDVQYQRGALKTKAANLCRPISWSMAIMLARPRRRRRAYALAIKSASHDNHEKTNSWVSFSFLSRHHDLIFSCFYMSMVLRSSHRSLAIMSRKLQMDFVNPLRTYYVTEVLNGLLESSITIETILCCCWIFHSSSPRSSTKQLSYERRMLVLISIHN